MLLGKLLTIHDVSIRGISDITPVDIERGRKENKTLKLVAAANIAANQDKVV